MAIMISLAGLPGTGKTTVARALARPTGALEGAVFLRVDVIEAELWRAEPGRDLRDLGYRIAAALAESNLALGLDVVVDCVNPWPVTRALFAGAAARVGAGFLGVELVCSDRAEHRRRVEGRTADLPGLVLPDWAAVEARPYLPWSAAALRFDTAELSAEQIAARIGARVPLPEP